MTLGGNPIPSMLVADLTDRQRHDIIRVLDGMIRSLTTAMPRPVFDPDVTHGLGYAGGGEVAAADPDSRGTPTWSRP